VASIASLYRALLEDDLTWLNATEAWLVRRVVIRSRHPYLRAVTVGVSRASNGWLYPCLAVVLLLVRGVSAWRVIVPAGVAAGLAYCVYPLIKRGLGRIRPCDADPSLDPPVKALDRYSCPSGHCIAATIVAVALVGEFAAATPFIAVGWLLIAWSRLSSGHHYPSDLVIGAALGAAAVLPIASMVLR
jgi:undecaprenyl-diphosphatase